MSEQNQNITCPVYSAIYRIIYGHPYLVLKHGTVSFSFWLVNLFRLARILKNNSKNDQK